MPIDESDDTVYDIPKETVFMDNDEECDSISTRIMATAKAHPVYLVLLSSALTAVLLVLVGAHDTTVTQPHIDHAQNLQLQAVKAEVREVKEEMKEIKEEIKGTNKELVAVNTTLVKLLAVKDRE